MRRWMLIAASLALGALAAAQEPQAEESVDRARMDERDDLDAYEAVGDPTVSAALRFDRARLALQFGAWDAARALLEPLVFDQPRSVEVQTNLGLAWMGTYYETYGLQQATAEQLQAALVDPEGAPSRLRHDEISLALARGFAIAGELPAGGTRGGGLVPEPLLRALDALEFAEALAPREPRAVLNLFVAEIEAARWDPATRADLADRAAEVEKGTRRWPAAEAALGWLDLGVYRYVVVGDVEEALDAFEAAEALGNPLGAYNRGLVLAFDEEQSSRREEGLAILASFAEDADAPARAGRAGLLGSRTAWPLGPGAVELSTATPEIAQIVALIEGEDLPDVEVVDYGGVSEARFPNGTIALVQPDVAAWIVLPAGAALDVPAVAATEAQAATKDLRAATAQAQAPRSQGARADARLPRPAPLTGPVLAQADVETVVVRMQEACLDADPLSADSRVVGATRGCATLVEVRLDR